VKFLADESCAGPVILALRQADHDVVALAEVAKGAVDEEVIERTLSERRVLITEDRDFGELVYARGRRSAGVLFGIADIVHERRAITPDTALKALAVFEMPGGIGAGLRYILSKQYYVNLRFDIAQRKNGHTRSMGVAEAF
jgi:predicted nuclease of predicted toxin-antitoxin system